MRKDCFKEIKKEISKEKINKIKQKIKRGSVIGNIQSKLAGIGIYTQHFFPTIGKIICNWNIKYGHQQHIGSIKHLHWIP